MRRKFKIAAITVSSILILIFFITVMNQVAIFTDFVSVYSPVLGYTVMAVFSLLLMILALLPVYLFVRLPAQLRYPDSDSPDEVAAYREKLAKNLNSNRYIKEQGLSVTPDNLDEALTILDDVAHKEVKRSASVVFVSTAVSQSGKLDAFIVFSLLAKMVWRIAHIYNQRPSYSGLLNLYANVAGTTLIAGSVDEIDISEQLEPVLGELIGASVFGAIPGLSQISAFTFSCLMEGSINSFLALRMGEVTVGYCRSVTKPDRKALRKSASKSAALRLKKIIREFSMEVITSIKNAGKKSSKNYIYEKSSWFRGSSKKREEEMTAGEYLGVSGDKS